MIVAVFSAAAGIAMGLVRPATARRILFAWAAALAMLMAVLVVAPDPNGAFNRAVIMAVAALPLGFAAGWAIGMIGRRITGGRRA